jgi:hypothetical protein
MLSNLLFISYIKLVPGVILCGLVSMRAALRPE